jgi:hypothetical protein
MASIISICLFRWDPEKAGDKPKMVEYKVGNISFTEQNSWVPVPVPFKSCDIGLSSP